MLFLIYLFLTIINSKNYCLFLQRMNKKLLLAIVGVIGAVEYRRYSNFIDTLSINTENLKLSKNGENIQANFQIVVTNKSTKSVDVKSLNGSLFSGNFKIGDFKINQSSTISANKTNIIPCVAIIDLKDFAKNINMFNPGSTIKLITNTVVNFGIAGLIKIPVSVKNTTLFDTTVLVSNLKSLIDNFSKLFLKK
jgi:LEA14-like dessication related protein